MLLSHKKRIFHFFDFKKDFSFLQFVNIFLLSSYCLQCPLLTSFSKNFKIQFLSEKRPPADGLKNYFHCSPRRERPPAVSLKNQFHCSPRFLYSFFQSFFDYFIKSVSLHILSRPLK